MLISFALLIAGCGGGSGAGATQAAGPQSTGASGDPTQVQWIASADAICKRIDGELAAAKPAGSSLKDTISVVSRHAAIERKGLSELRALTPPASLARPWHLLLGYRGRLARELTILLRDTKSRNVAAIRALRVSKRRAHLALRVLAKHAAFQDCGQLG